MDAQPSKVRLPFINLFINLFIKQSTEIRKTRRFDQDLEPAAGLYYTFKNWNLYLWGHDFLHSHPRFVIGIDFEKSNCNRRFFCYTSHHASYRVFVILTRFWNCYFKDQALLTRHYNSRFF